ncbi:glycosyltransferase [bacterium]|nr:glycosyltransferase [bacterium]
MRILYIDKTAGLASSHERHQAIAQQPGVDLHVLGPRHWVENGRPIDWQPDRGCAYHPHPGLVFGKDYYARAGYYWGMEQALVKAKPDLIQILEEPWSITAIQTVLYSSIFAPFTPLVFYTWENIYRPWQYPSRASLLYKYIDKILHQASVGAVCATQGAEQVLQEKGYPHPTTVIPYGIPNWFFEYKQQKRESSNPFTIGYIGRLMYMKGIDILLGALENLPDCHLILVGEGNDKINYQEQARLKNLQNRVEWLPPLSERRLPDVLQRMDVFVLPSRRVAGWQEQLGRVAIEAMAQGIPVIGSSSGAIPEVLGDAGLIFEENSTTDLIEKIQILKKDKNARHRLSQLGFHRAKERFTWQRFAEEIVLFYQKILRKTPVEKIHE